MEYIQIVQNVSDCSVNNFKYVYRILKEKCLKYTGILVYQNETHNVKIVLFNKGYTEAFRTFFLEFGEALLLLLLVMVLRCCYFRKSTKNSSRIQ